MSNPGFKNVPNTGVIYVMAEALKHGYSDHDTEWCNLGRGAPETSTLSNIKYTEPSSVILDHSDKDYGPVDGLITLREKIADYYNYFYRKNYQSKYTFENVSICSGSRIALARTLLALGNINIAHFVPDYTAYEELLGSIRLFNTIPYQLTPELRYHISMKQLEQEIKGRGLQCILKSNPCNPTGQVIMGGQLKELVNIVVRNQCSLIIDEVYSHFIYDNHIHNNMPTTVSAAEFVNKVNEDPIIIINGLSKNWRHPGWRIGWIVGPKHLIETFGSVGSFLDGGPNIVIQRLACSMLEPDALSHDIPILQDHFQQKRDYMIHRLEQMGIEIDAKPLSAFYIWANLSKLPEPLRDGMKFFELCLKYKVIVIPGTFFDVNPDKRRPNTRFKEYCRLSFGPDMDTLEKGLNKIEEMISTYTQPSAAKKLKSETKHNFVLRSVEDGSVAHEMYKLRYNYAAELGYDHPAMNHATHTFKDEFDNKAIAICAYDNEKVVGTVRAVLFRDFPHTHIELIEDYHVLNNINDASVENSLEVNRFVVLKEYEKYGIAMMLLVELAKKCLQIHPGLKYTFLVCVSDRVRYYEFLKFKKLGDPVYSECYKIDMQVMYLEHDDFFKMFKSVFAKDLQSK